MEEEGIKLAKKRCPSVTFEVKNIFDIKEHFDYLLASEVIEHIPNDEEFLEKIKSIFKKGALITTPNRNFYREDPYHVREYTVYEFEDLLRKHFSKFKIYMTVHNLYAWIEGENAGRDLT